MSAGTKKAIAAADTYTDWVDVPVINGNSTFNLVISGTWAGTASVQQKRSGEGDATAVTIKTYTANDAEKGDLGSGGLSVRAGFESGNYTSGTATFEITTA